MFQLSKFLSDINKLALSIIVLIKCTKAYSLDLIILPRIIVSSDDDDNDKWTDKMSNFTQIYHM